MLPQGGEREVDVPPQGCPNERKCGGGREALRQSISAPSGPDRGEDFYLEGRRAEPLEIFIWLSWRQMKNRYKAKKKRTLKIFYATGL